MNMDERAASQGMQAALETKDEETEPHDKLYSLSSSPYICVCVFVCVCTLATHTYTHPIGSCSPKNLD